MKEFLERFGLRRGIERHNFLIKNTLRLQAATFVYRGRVLDLGCGTSPFRDLVLRTASGYVGVDRPGSPHVGVAGNVAADIAKRLPFADGSFDTVISFQVLDDLPEPSQFLDECFRVLKSGGGLCLTVPFMWRLHEAAHDYYRFTKFGLDHILRRSGFADITVEEISPGFWGTLALKVNYHTLGLARGLNRFPMYLFWWMTQVGGMGLDRAFRSVDTSETTHYAVRAAKP